MLTGLPQAGAAARAASSQAAHTDGLAATHRLAVEPRGLLNGDATADGKHVSKGLYAVAISLQPVRPAVARRLVDGKYSEV